MDVYLKTKGVWNPVDWKNLEGYLVVGEPVEMERPMLFYSMSPLSDKGRDPEWFEEPVFVRWDNYWLGGVTDIQARTNAGIEEEKVVALEALPPLEDVPPKDVRVLRARPGVEERKGGFEYVRLSDGKGITCYRRANPPLLEEFETTDEWLDAKDNDFGPWRRLPGRRKKATIDDQQEFVELVHEEEPWIRQHAVSTRQTRDFIGHIIEALRRLPTIRLDAELEGERKEVDIGRQMEEARVSQNGGAVAKPGPKAGSGVGTLVRHMRDKEGVVDYQVLLSALLELQRDATYVHLIGNTPLSPKRLQRLYSDARLPHDSSCPYCNGGRRLPPVLAQVAYPFRPRTDN